MAEPGISTTRMADTNDHDQQAEDDDEDLSLSPRLVTADGTGTAAGCCTPPFHRHRHFTLTGDP